MVGTTHTASTSTSPAGQEPFSRVAPVLAAALLLGAGGGFVLATTLTLTSALNVPLGVWWFALAQAHGHLQVYGWAGLFVIGVALHFVPRLMGRRLAGARLVPWILAMLVTSLVLRAICQPLASTDTSMFIAAGLVISGLLECAALAGVVAIVGLTAWRVPSLSGRTALWSIWPFVVAAFASLALASVVNLANMLRLAGATSALVPANGDALDVTLGLFGFLVPMALAMSARALPMYAGLDAFPRRALWPLAWGYISGLVLICAGDLFTGNTWSRVQGLGEVLVGLTVFAFVGMFVRLMSSRGKIPRRVAALSPEPEQLARQYVSKVASERANYGPYVALIGSAYSWAILGGVLFIIDGLGVLISAEPFVSMDAIRHTFAIGFIALLICGVSSRMIPGFAGKSITSPKLVWTLLWVGNAAAILRVGALLFNPLLTQLGTAGAAIDSIAFGLSGPLGLTLAICLAWNLWPTVVPGRAGAAGKVS